MKMSIGKVGKDIVVLKGYSYPYFHKCVMKMIELNIFRFCIYRQVSQFNSSLLFEIHAFEIIEIIPLM